MLGPRPSLPFLRSCWRLPLRRRRWRPASLKVARTSAGASRLRSMAPLCASSAKFRARRWSPCCGPCGGRHDNSAHRVARAGGDTARSISESNGRASRDRADSTRCRSVLMWRLTLCCGGGRKLRVDGRARFPRHIIFRASCADAGSARGAIGPGLGLARTREKVKES
jgi:hypothetical protein